jgi:hypothetical protein
MELNPSCCTVQRTAAENPETRNSRNIVVASLNFVVFIPAHPTSFKQHGLWPRYFPPLESLNVQDLATSIRVVAPRCRHGRIPRAARHRLHDNVWMLAGLGSKGLIHHAVVAEAVIGAVIRNDANALPNEMKILYG